MYKKLCCALAAVFTFSSGYAQDEDQTPEEEVVVTGYRYSLQTSLDAKREATSIIESINAENLGQLPEVSISDSLARLPGLAQDRDRGNGSQISIRGMGGLLGLTTMNGREVATVEEDRNIRYDQFPSELVSGAQVYKTPQAYLPEGGLSGTVNIETVRPLESEKTQVALNFRASFYELADDIDDADPLGTRYSISYVDQFLDNTLGFALGVAGRTQPIASKRTEPWNYGDTFHNSGTSDNDTPSDTSDDFPINSRWGGQALIRGGEDERIGAMSVLQWQPHENFELIYDLFFSRFEIDEQQRGFNYDMANNHSDITATTPSNATNLPAGTLDVLGSTVGVWNVRNLNEAFTQKDDLLSTGLGAKWIFDQWTVTGDLAFSSTERDRLFVSFATTNSVATTGSPGSTITWNSSGDVLQVRLNDGIDLLDPAQNFPLQLQVNPLATGDDEITSFDLGLQRELEGGFFTSIQFGARLSERRKTLNVQQWTQFVTQNGSEPLAGTAEDLGFGNLPQFLKIDRAAATNLYFGGMVNPTPGDRDDLLAGWEVDEDIMAQYVQMNFESTLGVPVSGNIGVRAAQTDTEARGFQVQGLDIFCWDPAHPDFGSPGCADIILPVIPVAETHGYDEVLPSLNVIFELAEDKLVRFAWAKTIARAPVDFLSPAIDANTDRFGANPNESASGNAKLDPFRATQVDLAYDWYFAEESALTLAGFYKDMETYIARASGQTVTLGGEEFLLSLPINGSGGYIRGLEILYQQPFTDNFGIYLNYARTESNVEQFVPLNINPDDRFPLNGLSENVGTASFWYYNSGFEARLAYSFRSEFQRDVNRVTGEEGINGDEGYADLNFSYDLDEHYKFMFQIQNVTDEPYTVYGLETNNLNHINRYEEFGRRFLLGMSWTL
jgi:iron complex outermembrane receptor protein